MKKAIIYILAALFFLSCEETIELDLNQVDLKYVIDGLVTNELKQHKITLTKSVEFYEGGETPGVTNATVLVSDNNGNSWNFVHNNQIPGEYLSEEPFKGEVGNTYSLEVIVDGKTFTAQDELIRVTPIDSITWRMNEDEFEDPEDEGEFYEILIYTKEPQETEDYYFFRFYQNDTIMNYDNTEIFFADDVLIGESIDGIVGPEFYRIGDRAKFEMYSISREAFVYYSDLYTVLTNDGGMFGPVPANPRTNIEGGAVGLFQVSAIESAEIIIGE